MQCQQCDRTLGDDEPVYRVAGDYSGTSYTKWRGAIGSLCADCALATHEYLSNNDERLVMPIRQSAMALRLNPASTAPAR
jgi:hypothetical protein